MAVDTHAILFDVRRSIRYHDRRLDFFGRMHQITSVLTILLSGSILLQIAGAKYDPPWWLVLISLVAAILAAIDMVVGYAKMANSHHMLKQKFCRLEIDLLAVKSVQKFNECTARKIEIELDEPPVYRALDLLCRNEVMASYGYEKGHEDYVQLGIFVRITSHIWPWHNIGCDAKKASKNIEVDKDKKMNPQRFWIIAAVVVSVFIGYQYIGYTKYQESLASQDSNQKEIVHNSSYDGSVRQVEEWLEKNFNDAKSIERIEWSKVVKTEQGNYVVRYKFRANNESGGMQIYNKAFILGSTGIVITMTDYNS